jgi:hypothetical protein
MRHATLNNEERTRAQDVEIERAFRRRERKRQAERLATLEAWTVVAIVYAAAIALILA